jgi:hypothetical protein
MLKEIKDNAHDKNNQPELSNNGEAKDPFIECIQLYFAFCVIYFQQMIRLVSRFNAPR